MPDYNIYIHNLEGGSGRTSPTTPMDNSSGSGFGGSGFGEGSSFKPNTAQSFQSGQNGGIGQLGTNIAALKGAANLGKYGAIAAVVIAAAKVTLKVLSIGANHLETTTGNYEFSTNINNFKTLFSNISNPIGTMISFAEWNMQNERKNKEIEQLRSLVGTTSRGV